MKTTRIRRMIAALLLSSIALSLMASSALATVVESPPDSGSTGIRDDAKITIAGETIDYKTVKSAKSSANTTAKTFTKNGKLPTIQSTQDLLRLFNELGVFYDPTATPPMDYAVDEVAEDAVVDAEPPAAAPAPAATASGSMGRGSLPATDGDVSSTNVQVQGVDEGDIVKTDGRYIYYASAQNGSVSIISVNGKDMKLVSTIKLDTNFYFREMYLKGDKLVVVSNGYQSYPTSSDRASLYRYRGGYSLTRFEVYNIANRAKPVGERKLYLRGNSLQTRMVDNYLYFVVQDYVYSIPYDVRIMDEDILPAYSDSAAGDSALRTIAPTSIRIFPGRLSPSYMMVGGFDIASQKPCLPQCYLGNSSDLYMSKTRMYVAQNSWDGDKTNLFRFDVSKGNVTYTGSGQVDGHILNQYSMDEYGTNFRIATTTWANTANSKTKNHLYVLNKNMDVVGSVKDMAPGETIQSVRFTGDTGYIVTYRRTDPLFVIDLKTPSKPKVLGQLKVPGFSSYLHPVADGVVVGIGRQTTTLFYTDASGKRVDSGQEKDMGLKLSMFDVKNPRAPRQMFYKVLGNEYTQSEVSYNARALMVDLKKGVLGIPVYSYDWSSGKDNSWWGAYIVAFSTRTGFSVRGELKANKPSNNYYYDTNSRTCYIGNNLYMVSGNTIYAYNYTNCRLLATKTLFTIQMDQPITYDLPEPGVVVETVPIAPSK